jgi:hypothetical protein
LVWKRSIRTSGEGEPTRKGVWEEAENENSGITISEKQIQNSTKISSFKK